MDRSGWRPYELEVLPGLEPFAEEELRVKLGRAGQMEPRTRPGRLPFRYRGDPRRLHALRTAVALHLVVDFAVPRPRALLGDEHLRRLLALPREVIALHPPGAFATFRLSAAGADSAVFARLKAALGTALGLAEVEENPHLLVAVRRPPGDLPGWQVLVRTTPRPLAARPWRVRDMPGALNATAAAVMAGLSGPGPGERYLNLACGSGTLLVERLELGPARLAVGVDLSPEALGCARANLQAARRGPEVLLIRADASRLPLADASFDTAVADLPFGMLMGQASENERLYPALLAEASRVLAPGGHLVAITASTRLFKAVLGRFAEWRLLRTVQVQIPYQSGYLRPDVFLLRRAVDPLQPIPDSAGGSG